MPISTMINITNMSYLKISDKLTVFFLTFYYPKQKSRWGTGEFLWK